MAGLTITDPVELHVALTSDQIKAGDKIYLRGGTYRIVGLSCPLKGTAQAHITIQPYNNETVTILPASGTRCLTISGAYLDFKGLIFDGSNITEDAIKVTGAQAITLDGLEIKSAKRHGVLASYTDGLTIKNCTIRNGGTDTSLDHPIYVTSQVSSALIQANTIHDWTGYGVHFYGGEGDKTYTIEKNYIYNQANKAGIGCFHGVATVRNNVVRSCYRGIGLDYAIVQAYAYHNTIVSSTQYAIYSIAPSANNSMEIIDNLFDSATYGLLLHNDNSVTRMAIVKNNLYSQMSTAAVDIDASIDLTRSGEVTATCTPVTDNGAQYIPGAGNPAKGAGLALASITADYGGNARSNPPTIGAWE